MQQYYGGIIWTNHALKRMDERGLKQETAYDAFNHPDASQKGSERDSVQYRKKFGDKLVTVVAKQNEKNEWVIISAWIDPPMPGSIDEKRKAAYRNYQKASFWMKLFITLKRQLGISRY